MTITGVADGVHWLPRKSDAGSVPQEVISLEIGPAVEGSVTGVLSEGDLGTGLVTGECCMDGKTGQRTEAWGRAFPAPERNSLPQFPSTLVSGSRLLDLWDSRFLLSRFVLVTLTKLQYWFIGKQ